MKVNRVVGKQPDNNKMGWCGRIGVRHSLICKTLVFLPDSLTRNTVLAHRL